MHTRSTSGSEPDAGPGARQPPNFQLGDAWFGNFREHALSAGETPLRVPGTYSGPGAAGCWHLTYSEQRRFGFPIITLRSLTNYYSTLFGFSGQTAPAAAADVLTGHLREQRGSLDVVSVDSLAAWDPVSREVPQALRRGGMAVQVYPQFGTWYELTRGLDYDDYLARLPSQLRSTIRRKSKRLSRSHEVAFQLHTVETDIEQAIAEYDSVYAKSWKIPEPHPHFVPGLITTLLRTRSGLVGILRVDDQPAACQIWIVHGHRATIFKLAYDEAYKQASVGTILTAHMFQSVLDLHRPRIIDFGRGDDAYKRDWLPRRYQCWGVVAGNLRRPGGAATALRHVLPDILRGRERNLVPDRDDELLAEHHIDQ